LHANATTPAEFSDILGLNGAGNNLPNTSSNEKKIYYDYLKILPPLLKKEVKKKLKKCVILK